MIWRRAGPSAAASPGLHREIRCGRLGPRARPDRSSRPTTGGRATSATASRRRRRSVRARAGASVPRAHSPSRGPALLGIENGQQVQSAGNDPGLSWNLPPRLGEIPAALPVAASSRVFRHPGSASAVRNAYTSLIRSIAKFALVETGMTSQHRRIPLRPRPAARQVPVSARDRPWTSVTSLF